MAQICLKQLIEPAYRALAGISKGRIGALLASCVTNGNNAMQRKGVIAGAVLGQTIDYDTTDSLTVEDIKPGQISSFVGEKNISSIKTSKARRVQIDITGKKEYGLKGAQYVVQEWPRVTKWQVSTEEIPWEIKDATCILAREFTRNGLPDIYQKQDNKTAYSTSGISIQWNGEKKITYPAVEKLLRPFLKKSEVVRVC